MEESKIKTPHLAWAQRKETVLVTIQQSNLTDIKISLPEETKISFSAKSGDCEYKFELELYAPLDTEKSKWILDTRNVQLSLKKKEDGPFWPRLTKNKVKADWLKVDWSRYVDEDDEEKPNEDFQFDPSMMQNFGQKMEDSDDEEDNKADEVDDLDKAEEPK